MSLTIVSAIIAGATTLICCPLIRQYCQTSENVQSEKITKDDVNEDEAARNEEQAETHLQEIRRIIIKSNVEQERSAERSVASTNTNSSFKVEQVSPERNINKIPQKSLRALKQSCDKGDSAEVYEPKKASQLVDQTIALTAAITNYLESCEKREQAVTVALKSSSNGSLLINEQQQQQQQQRQQQIPISRTNIDSSKSVSQIPETKSPELSVRNSRTSLRNTQHNSSSVNHAMITEDTDYLQLPATHMGFMKDIKEKEKNKDYLQSTKIGSKKSTRMKKNSLFKKLRTCVQPMSARLPQFFCRTAKERKKDK